MWITLKTLNFKVFGIVCLRAELPSSTYVPDKLLTDSTNSNGLLKDTKCVFSAADLITVPKTGRLSLITLASMLGGFLLTQES